MCDSRDTSGWKNASEKQMKRETVNGCQEPLSQLKHSLWMQRQTHSTRSTMRSAVGISDHRTSVRRNFYLILFISFSAFSPFICSCVNVFILHCEFFKLSGMHDGTRTFYAGALVARDWDDGMRADGDLCHFPIKNLIKIFTLWCWRHAIVSNFAGERVDPPIYLSCRYALGHFSALH